MTHHSMTGFARHESDFENTFWAWEIRSVNGKGLDLRMRIPFGFEAVEVPAKKLLTKFFSRGNMQVSLVIDSSKSELEPSLNEAVVDALMEAAEKVRAKTGGEMPSVADLMSMRGVIEIGEGVLNEKKKKARQDAILASLEIAARNLVTMRQQEGNAIATVLKEQMQAISDMRDRIDQNQSRTPEAIFENMRNQIANLIKDADKFDNQRLHQEAVILATKADLQEELDRLAVHLKSAGELLEGPGPVGRKLDFLAQEFHRECNTICSKSNAPEVTTIGLDMKLVIDQFREQIQNME